MCQHVSFWNPVLGDASDVNLFRDPFSCSLFIVSISDGLQPMSNGLQPRSDGLQPVNIHLSYMFPLNGFLQSTNVHDSPVLHAM